MRYPVIRTTALLVTLALAGLASATAAPAVETARIEVVEGIELATDVYHPAKEPAPVILIRTPYGRKGHDFIGEAFAARGYAVAIQDVRGKYDSSGEHEPFRHERTDGSATLAWIAKQPWCNGRIGMWGISYSGYSGLVLADSEMKQLASILSFSGWLEAEDVVKPGGAMHLMLDLPWMITQQGNQQRGLGEFDGSSTWRRCSVIHPCATRCAPPASATRPGRIRTSWTPLASAGPPER